MTIEEIFQNLISHFSVGLIFHNQEMMAYGFLQLKGYEAFHKHQYLEESDNYLNVLKYYLTHYRKLLPEQQNATMKVIPLNWYKHTSDEVDTTTIRSGIKDLMKEWVNWEEETKKLLEKTYKELYELGEVRSALFVSKLLLNIDGELCFARKELDNLEAINYDLSVIIPEQEKLYEEYAE